MPRPIKITDVDEFYRRLADNDPEPKGELDYRNEFTLLVAVVLSAQATDVGVNKATEALFKLADTPEKMLALGEARLKHCIRAIGLYNAKAKNIIRLSEILVKEHQGKVPDRRAALEALPGVGRKTASIVLNDAFGYPAIGVDTHIFRLANRTGLARGKTGKTPEAVADRLEAIVPASYKPHAHHWLILHGRHVCKARKPDCPNCVVSELCAYGAKTTV